MPEPVESPSAVAVDRVSNNVAGARLMTLAHVAVSFVEVRDAWRKVEFAAPATTHSGLPQFASPAAAVVGAILFSVVVVWLVGGPIWLTLNALGLKRRRPWARRSMLVYWGLSIPFCLGFSWYGLCLLVPLCVYGIWSLTRPAVVALFTQAQESAPDSIGPA